MIYVENKCFISTLSGKSSPLFAKAVKLFSCFQILLFVMLYLILLRPLAVPLSEAPSEFLSIEILSFLFLHSFTSDMLYERNTVNSVS